ncbi:MAG: membrane protein insertion efficiency factor YidD [Candidatus Omnitrophica bacterium]|nr:membrane protein insertion efficiency factor YidD [Candidatus Omnitrophota bacterium]
MKIVSYILAQFCILLIRGYQITISRLFPPACRHIPSCSQYAIAAIQEHGPLRGVALSGRRLLRCHPWGSHGYDPVPTKNHCHADTDL